MAAALTSNEKERNVVEGDIKNLIKDSSNSIIGYLSLCVSHLSNSNDQHLDTTGDSNTATAAAPATTTIQYLLTPTDAFVNTGELDTAKV